MVCTNCKSTSRNKKGCPQLAQSTQGNPPPEKGNGADQGNKLSFSVSQRSKKQRLLEVEEEVEAGEVEGE